MTCIRIGEGNFVVYVCRKGRATAPARCDVPGCREIHQRLCDYETGRHANNRKKTCDAKLCLEHALGVEDRDYCPDHAPLVDTAEQLGLFPKGKP